MNTISLESDIKRRCKIDLGKAGWMIVHVIQTNCNGFPDTIALRNGRIVFIEFKRKSKNPRQLQEYRHEQLRKQGFEVIVVRDRADIVHML